MREDKQEKQPGRRFVEKNRTSEVAKMMGIHPNTVRFYEEWGLITKPVREENGYRVFNDLHLYQIQVVRLGFEIEILQNGLRKKIVDMIKTCARCDFDGASGRQKNIWFS